MYVAKGKSITLRGKMVNEGEKVENLDPKAAEALKKKGVLVDKAPVLKEEEAPKEAPKPNAGGSGKPATDK